MKKIIFLITSSVVFFNGILNAQTPGQVTPPPLRIACQTITPTNSSLIQLRSDAGDKFRPPIVNIVDSFGKLFKDVVSQQVVYSDSNITVLFVAGTDSFNRFGVFRSEVNNVSKITTTKFVNLLNPSLKNYLSYSNQYSFSLFSYKGGYLVYPSNEFGQWRLLSLSNNTVVKEWTHSSLVFNPYFTGNAVAWISFENKVSTLFLYDLKTDSQNFINYKDTVQILGTNKNELILANFYELSADKKTVRIQGYSGNSSRLITEFDSMFDQYSNFVLFGSNLIFTFEKTFILNNQIQVVEASINVYDIFKRSMNQRIQYPPFLTDLMRRQSPLQIKLLNSPIFNVNEILFSLNEMGGIVKYQFKSANWYYLNYPFQENRCYNPSWVQLIE